MSLKLHYHQKVLQTLLLLYLVHYGPTWNPHPLPGQLQWSGLVLQCLSRSNWNTTVRKPAKHSNKANLFQHCAKRLDEWSKLNWDLHYKTCPRQKHSLLHCS